MSVNLDQNSIQKWLKIDAKKQPILSQLILVFIDIFLHPIDSKRAFFIQIRMHKDWAYKSYRLQSLEFIRPAQEQKLTQIKVSLRAHSCVS